MYSSQKKRTSYNSGLWQCIFHIIRWDFQLFVWSTSGSMDMVSVNEYNLPFFMWPLMINISKCIQGDWTLQCQTVVHRSMCKKRRLKQVKSNCMPVADAFLQGHAWWPKCIWTDSCIIHVLQSVWSSVNQAEMSSNCNVRLTTMPFLLKHMTTTQSYSFYFMGFFSVHGLSQLSSIPLS